MISSIAEGQECHCISKVLVVDDNEFNLMPIAMLLKTNHGLESIKATDGEEAVQVFRRDRAKKCCNVRIKMVLMDLMMPICDGFDATN